MSNIRTNVLKTFTVHSDFDIITLIVYKCDIFNSVEIDNMSLYNKKL